MGIVILLLLIFGLIVLCINNPIILLVGAALAIVIYVIVKKARDSRRVEAVDVFVQTQKSGTLKATRLVYLLKEFFQTSIWNSNPGEGTRYQAEVISLYETSLRNNTFIDNSEKIDRAADSMYSDVKIKIMNCTMKYIDELCAQNGIVGYSFVDITRSSNDRIRCGRYIYKINDRGDIVMLKVPVKEIIVPVGEPLVIFSLKNLENPIIVLNENIKDFQVFGSEMIQTDTSLSMGQQKSGLILSEAFFGASYAIMKGLSSASLTSTHSVKDTRSVQLVFTDKTDIELKGMQIFYDFNRYFGIAKNNENSVLRFENRKKEHNQFLTREKKLDLEGSKNISQENDDNF